MNGPEFSRPYRLDTLGSGERAVSIEAEPAERAALAARFGLILVERLQAEATLVRHGETVEARGSLVADVTQRCVATDEPLPAHVKTGFALRFVPPQEAEAGAEVELSEEDCDTIDYEGAAIDLGDAVAETMALELDPFPRSAGAEAVLRAAGVIQEGEEEPSGAFAGLKAMLEAKKPSA